jgi:hypothetical protein
MRRSFVLLGIAAGLIPAAVLAQMAGGAPSGSTPDISNSDLGGHDSFSTPDLHDQVMRERQRELSEKLQATAGSPGPSRPAKASELVVGTTINDKTGVPIAKIDRVDADGVVVAVGAAKVKVPAEAFGHNKRGLLLDMTRNDFDKVVVQAK